MADHPGPVQLQRQPRSSGRSTGYVFLSHASKDRDLTLLVKAELERHGINCWIDQRDIEGAADWPDSLERAILDSSLVLVVFTHSTADAVGVRKEVAFAQERGKKCLLVRYNNAPLTGGFGLQFANLQHLSVAPTDGDTPPALVDRVAAAGGFEIIPYASSSAALERRAERAISTFHNPDAIRIILSSVSGRLGRDTDCQQLSHLLSRYRCVALKGESGVGKSSLVRNALAESLAQTAESPLFVIFSSSDWYDGIDVELAWSVLSLSSVNQAAIRQHAGVHAEPNPGDGVRLVQALHSITGRQILLVFDDFERYLRDNSHFLINPADGVQLDQTHLRDTNPFWKGIASLVEDKKARILYVCQEEVPECFMFGARPATGSAVKPLCRLKHNSLRLILDRVERECVSNPAGTWANLRYTFESDLLDNDWFLPSRVALAIEGLTRLSELSLEAYHHAGGIEGLEARFLSHEIKNATSFDPAKQAWVLDALASLVDPMLRQAVPRTALATSRYIREFTGLTVSEVDVQDLFSKLADSRVTRAAGRDPSAAPLWTLYHSYLCDAVLRLSTRAVAQLELNRRFAQFQRQPSLLARLRSLLALFTLHRFLLLRARRRLRFGMARPFVLYSLLAWYLPLFLLLVCGALSADFGVRVPLGAETRNLLDREGISLFRRPHSDSETLAAIEANCSRLRSDLLSRYDPQWGYFSVQAQHDTTPDYWTNTQAIACLAELSRRFDLSLQPALTRALDSIYDTRRGTQNTGQLLTDDNQPEGWNWNRSNPAPTICATAWAGSALAKLHDRLPPERSAPYLDFFNRSLTRFSGKSGWYLVSPWQLDRKDYTRYGTTLTLNLLLDFRDANVQFEGKDRDEMIQTTFDALVHDYRAELNPPGWCDSDSTDYDTPRDAPGLTLQVYGVLFRASAALPRECNIPPRMRQNAAQLIANLTDRFDGPIDYRSKYRNIPLKQGTIDAAVTFLTGPWALAACVRYFEAADITPVPADERRLIDKRFRDLACLYLPRDYERTHNVMTYQIAEYAYAYGIAYNYLSRHAKIPPATTPSASTIPSSR
jgi:hypothetical protein